MYETQSTDGVLIDDKDDNTDINNENRSTGCSQAFKTEAPDTIHHINECFESDHSCEKVKSVLIQAL